MSIRYKLIASGYLILVRDENILLSRRFQTGYEDGKYSLPAGHMEEHETIREGTCREVQEEIGVILKPDNLDLVHVMHRKDWDERIDFFFTTKKWNGEPKNMEPDRCDDLAWFPLDQLPANTVPYIRAAIENFQKKIWYAEFGWKK